MSSQLASLFDPLGMASLFLLGGKLILQKVSSSGVGWDDLPSFGKTHYLHEKFARDKLMFRL